MIQMKYHLRKEISWRFSTSRASGGRRKSQTARWAVSDFRIYFHLFVKINLRRPPQLRHPTIYKSYDSWGPSCFPLPLALPIYS